MIKNFEEGFISSLPKIPFNELPIKPSDNKLPNSPAVWFAIADTNEVLFVGRAKNLCNRLSKKHEKREEFEENNVLYIAYWELEEKEIEHLHHWEKKAKDFFAPPLNNNKSKILVPAINNLIKQLKTIEKQKEITKRADTSHNYLNKFEDRLDANASKLEKILLSDLVSENIFDDYFIRELKKLWKKSKRESNNEQQSKLDDNAALEDAALGKSQKKRQLLNKLRKKE